MGPAGSDRGRRTGRDSGHSPTPLPSPQKGRVKATCSWEQQLFQSTRCISALLMSCCHRNVAWKWQTWLFFNRFSHQLGEGASLEGWRQQPGPSTVPAAGRAAAVPGTAG